jgi:hypothetical protein
MVSLLLDFGFDTRQRDNYLILMQFSCQVLPGFSECREINVPPEEKAEWERRTGRQGGRMDMKIMPSELRN